MRYFIAIAAVAFLFVSCKKDKYTTAPQIEYVSVDPNFVDGTIPLNSNEFTSAKVNFSITDGEGDLGFKGKDTSFIFIKNLLTGKADSVIFPDLTAVKKKDFKAVVSSSLAKVIEKRTNPNPNVAKTDTIFFEVYVKDFAKNKSNVIRTADPVFFKYF